MIKFRTLFIGLALVAALMMVSACSSNEPTGQPTAAKETPAQPAAAQQESKPAAEMNQTSQAQPAAEAQPAAQTAQQAEQTAQPAEAAPQTLAITGMVEKTDAGIVIATGMGKYLVNGQDLSNMIGKTVNVTGTVQEAMGTYTIDVVSVEEAK